MAFTTYAELQDSILAILESLMVGEDLSNYIRLAEGDVFPMIKHYMMETTVTMTTANNIVTWPDDFQEARSIRADGRVTQMVSPFNSNLHGREIGYYQRANTYVFVPPIDTPRSIELTYNAMPPHLSATQTTNWLLKKFPQVYLHAALVRAYRFRRDPESEAQEKASLGEALGDVAQDHKRATQGGNTIIMNDGGPYYVD